MRPEELLPPPDEDAPLVPADEGPLPLPAADDPPEDAPWNEDPVPDEEDMPSLVAPCEDGVGVLVAALAEVPPLLPPVLDAPLLALGHWHAP